jgi:RNA recognition motif-containing protein
MNIYVSNLGFNVKDEDLKNLFTQHGEVSSAKVIMDNFSGQSRGFAFVEMPNDEEGQKAIDQLHNSELSSRTISVQVARPKEERKGSYPARNNGNSRRY